VCIGSGYAGQKIFARRVIVSEEWDNKIMNITNQNGFTVE
jgi:hypothetical protein